LNWGLVYQEQQDQRGILGKQSLGQSCSFNENGNDDMSTDFENTYAADWETIDMQKQYQFTTLPYQPVYTSVVNYQTFGEPIIIPIEYTGWRDETMAWQLTSAISSNLNPTPAIKLKGSDAVHFLKKYLVNDFDRFPVGSSKHGIICTERGNVAANGVLLRTDEDTFEAHWLSPWLNIYFSREKLNATLRDITQEHFIFQIFGPRSLEIIENAAREDLHDIKFCRFRQSTIDGRQVRILRFGMTGGLGYEVHGKVEDAKLVHLALMKAGAPFGMRQLGIKAYMMCHTPGGCQQFSLHYGQDVEPELMQYFASAGTLLNGSAGDNRKKRYMNPYELGLGKIIDFNGSSPLCVGNKSV
jgi:glycine cleavage system aminomethyltransferase T